MLFFAKRFFIIRVMHDRMFSVALGIILVLSACVGDAGEIYKYLDAEGNVTYSSSPPPVPLRFEILEIPDETDSVNNNTAMLEQIRLMAAQLEEDRKQREQARAEARREQEQTQATPAPSPEIHYYPLYPPGYFIYRHQRLLKSHHGRDKSQPRQKPPLRHRPPAHNKNTD